MSDDNGYRDPGMGGVVRTFRDGASSTGTPALIRRPGAAEFEAARAAERAMEERRGSPVNAKPTMSYEEAMALRTAGKLHRSVLTPEGWVMPSEGLPINRSAA